MTYSPVLAAVTAGLEVLAAAWALWRGGRRATIRTIAAILVFLAGYQVTEIAICSNAGAAGFLPRLAFLVVTWLPPFGVLLIAQLPAVRSRVFTGAAVGMFAAAAAVAVWILVDPGFASVSTCSVVFARFTSTGSRFLIYAIFYWTGLFLMLLLSTWGAARARGPKERRSLFLVFGGSAAFIVPSLVLTQYVGPAKDALPSVMCHLAFLLAVALVGIVYVNNSRESSVASPQSRSRDSVV